MKYSSTLLAVKEMERSKQFYKEILDLDVTADFGANVVLSQGICLQTADSWGGFINKGQNEIILGNNAIELYFEEDDIDSFMDKLNNCKSFDIILVHPLEEASWGQRSIRFYDPDKHIIEVGETIVSVIKEFKESGMTNEEVAVRMDVPVDYIESCLSEKSK